MPTKKRPELNPDEQAGLFRRTEPAIPQEQEQPPDPIRAIGIGLKTSEWAKIDDIAAALGTTRHKISLYALRDFIRRYESGDIPVEKRPTLPGL